MTRITPSTDKNVFSVIMDILEMDHFREPEQEEVQNFLESTGTHGSIVGEETLYMEASAPKIQTRNDVIFSIETPEVHGQH